MKIGLSIRFSDPVGWARFWSELARLPDLDSAEAELLADTARQGMKLYFEREVDPEGQPWHPLAPRTRKERELGIDERGVPFSVGPAHPIMVRTGDMKRAVTDPRHPDHVSGSGTFNNTTVIVVGARENERLPGRLQRMQYGGFTSDLSLVPPRPFIGISREMERALERDAVRILDTRAERLADG